MFDFQTLTANSRKYNFHSHTQFCDGRSYMASFAAAAAAAGFSHYGFSPHSPVRGVDSPCNMSFGSVDEYLAEFSRLKEEYAGSVNLLCSMEIDYLGADWGPSTEYFQSLPLDYRIGSVHFVPGPHGPVDIDGNAAGFRRKVDTLFDGDIRHVVELFYSRTRDMIAAGGFDLIGHFDKIGHNASHYRPGIEREPWYTALVQEACDMIIDTGLTVEINTKAWQDHRRFFPSPRWWKRLLGSGVPVIVNSDAHYPALIDASRPLALSLLDALS